MKKCLVAYNSKCQVVCRPILPPPYFYCRFGIQRIFFKCCDNFFFFYFTRSLCVISLPSAKCLLYEPSNDTSNDDEIACHMYSEWVSERWKRYQVCDIKNKNYQIVIICRHSNLMRSSEKWRVLRADDFCVSRERVFTSHRVPHSQNWNIKFGCSRKFLHHPLITATRKLFIHVHFSLFFLHSHLLFKKSERNFVSE